MYNVSVQRIIFMHVHFEKVHCISTYKNQATSYVLLILKGSSTYLKHKYRIILIENRIYIRVEFR